MQVLCTRCAGRDVHKDTAELRESPRGRITEHHRRMLWLHLQLIDASQRTLAELGAAVGKVLAPIPSRAPCSGRCRGQ